MIRIVTTAADGNGAPPIGNVSPIPAPPNAQYEHPSIAALPNGKVAIAYYDAVELAGARHDLLAVGRPGGRPELRPDAGHGRQLGARAALGSARRAPA